MPGTHCADPPSTNRSLPVLEPVCECRKRKLKKGDQRRAAETYRLGAGASPFVRQETWVTGPNLRKCRGSYTASPETILADRHAVGPARPQLENAIAHLTGMAFEQRDLLAVVGVRVVERRRHHALAVGAETGCRAPSLCMCGRSRKYAAGRLASPACRRTCVRGLRETMTQGLIDCRRSSRASRLATTDSRTSSARGWTWPSGSVR
jgi:hypothetical protein